MAWIRLLLRASLIWLALCSGFGDSRAGECVGATSAYAIIHELGQADPDDLTSDKRALLGCLTYPVYALRSRPLTDLPPSWRLLRNKRRVLRDLGRNPEVIQPLKRLVCSQDPETRRAACSALFLYGNPAYRDSADIFSGYIPSTVMTLALVGDTTGVDTAIAAYAKTHFKALMLDALYYQSTARAIGFIERVAAEEADPAVRERAKWMIRNPMPVKEAWRL